MDQRPKQRKKHNSSEDNIEEMLFYIGFGNDFLDMLTEAHDKGRKMRKHRALKDTMKSKKQKQNKRKYLQIMYRRSD